MSDSTTSPAPTPSSDSPLETAPETAPDSTLETAPEASLNLAEIGAQIGGNFGARLDSEEFSWREAVGGWRGIIESVGPTLVFVVAFVCGLDVWKSGAIALGIAVGLGIARMISHQTLTQAFAGFTGVIIGVLWAAFSGKGENYFLYGLILNAVYFVVLLVSVLTRFPLIGLAVGWFRSQGLAWRSDERLRKDRGAYYAVTFLWMGLFGARLAVKVPLYFAGNVWALGALHLLMGVPLFAIVIYLSWLLLRRTHGGFLDSGLEVDDTHQDGS